jgi:peptidyl-Lys metalloendopeptidase
MKSLIVFFLLFQIPMQNKDLTVEISLDKEKFKINEEINLHFIISNNSKKSAKFCKIQTPCEGFRGIYFSIIHLDSGKELDYVGPMVKRMPPQADDYEVVKQEGSEKCSLVLNKAFKFNKSGKYSIQFKGSPVNDLPDSNVLTIEVEE